MKKIILLVLVLFMFMTYSSKVFAQMYVGPVELTGEKMTVAEALEAKGGTQGYIKGNIIAQISYDEYRFEDSTGIMVVIIKRDVFPTKALDENSEIYIVGEVNSFRRYPNKFYVNMLKLANF